MTKRAVVPEPMRTGVEPHENDDGPARADEPLPEFSSIKTGPDEPPPPLRIPPPLGF